MVATRSHAARRRRPPPSRSGQEEEAERAQGYHDDNDTGAESDDELGTSETSPDTSVDRSRRRGGGGSGKNGGSGSSSHLPPPQGGGGAGTGSGGRPPLPPGLPPAAAGASAAPGLAGNRFRAHVEFVEKPRQMLVLGALMLGMAYLGYAHDDPTKEGNMRAGLLAIAFTFLTHCFLQCRDTVIIRPHPGVWRVVHGLGMLYLMCIAVLLVHDKAGAREIVRVFVPDIGDVPAPKTPGSGGDAFDCSINARTVWRQLTEIWFVAHALGWWGKMVMFRDWGVCWLLSIGFEILECTLQFIIPEFKECWWDSLLIDLLGANLLGMAAGWATLKAVETNAFDWSGTQCRSQGRLRRLINRLSPYSFTRYRWSMFSSFKRFLQVIALVVVTLTMELNAFMLLHTLQIPKASAFNKIRLTLVALLAIPSAAEYYDFIANPLCTRLGPNCWCMLAVMQLEIVVWLKFWPANFVVTTPPADIGVPWMVTLTLLGLWMFLSLILAKEGDLGARFKPSTQQQQQQQQMQQQQMQQQQMQQQQQAAAAAPIIASPPRPAAAAAAVAMNGGGGSTTNGRRASLSRKEVTVGLMQEVVDMLFFLSFLPLLWLIKQWAF